MDVDWFGSGLNLTYQLFDLQQELITVPAGSFYSLDKRTTFTKTDGSMIDLCGDYTYLQHRNYVKNVGLVFSNYSYFDQIPICINRERRLIYYNIPQ